MTVLQECHCFASEMPPGGSGDSPRHLSCRGCCHHSGGAAFPPLAHGELPEGQPVSQHPCLPPKAPHGAHTHKMSITNTYWTTLSKCTSEKHTWTRRLGTDYPRELKAVHGEKGFLKFKSLFTPRNSRTNAKLVLLAWECLLQARWVF